MNQEQQLRFFTTPAHNCSYLTNQQATTLLLDPDRSVDQQLSGFLAGNGFRRSGSHYYHPYCKTCNECISVRVLARIFHPPADFVLSWR